MAAKLAEVENMGAEASVPVPPPLTADDVEKINEGHKPIPEITLNLMVCAYGYVRRANRKLKELGDLLREVYPDRYAMNADEKHLTEIFKLGLSELERTCLNYDYSGELDDTEQSMKLEKNRITASLRRVYLTVFDYAFPTRKIRISTGLKPSSKIGGFKLGTAAAAAAPAAAAGGKRRSNFKDDEAMAAGDEGEEEEGAAAAPAPAGRKVTRSGSGAKPSVAVPGEAAYASLDGSPTGVTQDIGALGVGGGAAAPPPGAVFRQISADESQQVYELDSPDHRGGIEKVSLRVYALRSMNKMTEALSSPVIADVRTAISSSPGDTITIKKAVAEALVTARTSAKKASQKLQRPRRGSGGAGSGLSQAAARTMAAAGGAAAAIKHAKAGAK